jgi:hypothetical protein
LPGHKKNKSNLKKAYLVKDITNTTGS